MQKLDQIQEQVGCPLRDFQNGSCEYSPTGITATFCISQGRGLNLGAEWAIGAPVEWEAGLGWAEVADAKATWAPSHPLLIPITPLVQIPLPTEASLALGAGLGRLVDICVELPVELGPDDQGLVDALAGDINAKPYDGLAGGRFQRRAHRLLNYTKRRIPGIQRQTILNALDNPSIAADETSASDEFDNLDNAMDNIITNGLTVEGGPLNMFRDPNVNAIRSSFDSLPLDVDNIISNPEQIFDGFEQFSNNIGDLDCDKYGVTADLRAEKAGLERLCSRLESLPDFEAVQAMMNGQLLDGVAELLQPLLENASGVQETAAETKNRFCASAIGQRRLFDNYCGR